MASIMKSISLLSLYACLAVAADNAAYWTIPLSSDSSQRYTLNVKMGTGNATQRFNLALSGGTPFTSVAGTGCSSCGGVDSYNQQISTTAQTLGNSAGINLIGGGSTYGPLITETCALQASNGSNWNYPNQTIIVSNQSTVYGGSVSGLVGLASGRPTGNLSASIVGALFGRQPNRPSIVYGLALQPPNTKATENAGFLHWLGSDSSSYTGDITWKTTTVTSNSDVALFAIDGWQFKTGGTTVINSNQDLSSAIDPYYVNMFFPSQEAQLIHAAVKGSSSQLANDGQSTIYVVPCNTKLSLSTTIGGQAWQVDQALLIQKQDNGTCVSNIQGWADPNNKQYLFGSAFLSSLYVIVQIGNPNGSQNDQIGFARRSKPPSIVGPVVGGVVGGVGGIAIISLAIFFWVRRRDQKKMKDMLDSEDTGGNVGRFVENKDVQPFPFTAQPVNVPPTSPTALSYASASRPTTMTGIIEGVPPHSPNVNDPLLPPSYDQAYAAGPSNPSQQEPNLFPGHARKN